MFKKIAPKFHVFSAGATRYLEVLNRGDENFLGTISLRQAKLIANNLLKGKPYWLASPVYNLSRVEMAMIHIHAREILALN